MSLLKIKEVQKIKQFLKITAVLTKFDEVSDTESGRQIQRYIRLTYLIPELLKLVDDGLIAFTPAFELSFLSENEQEILLN